MGYHGNVTIYTGNEARVNCRRCRYGEFVKSADIFTREAYICWNSEAFNSDDGCTEFKLVTEKQKKQLKKIHAILKGEDYV